jgi:hypothetical protein
MSARTLNKLMVLTHVDTLYDIGAPRRQGGYDIDLLRISALGFGCFFRERWRDYFSMCTLTLSYIKLVGAMKISANMFGA